MSTSPRRPRRVCSPETAAKMSFEAMDFGGGSPLPSRAEFLRNAANAYDALASGAVILTKSPEDLATALRQADDGDGKSIVGVLDELAQTKEWFDGYVKALGYVEARVLVAASRVVAEAST